VANGLIPLRQGTWKGQTDLTVFDNAERSFTTLENVYHSSDGTELRRFPGWRPVAIPTWNSQFYDAVTNDFEIASYAPVFVAGTTCNITLSAPHRIANGTQYYVFIEMSKWTEQGSVLIPDGAFGGLGDTGIDGLYLATFNNVADLSGKTITIAPFVGGSALDTTNASKASATLSNRPAGRIYVWTRNAASLDKNSPVNSFFFAYNNLAIPHGLASVRDRLVLIGESDYRRTHLIAAGDAVTAYSATSGPGPYSVTITVSITGVYNSANYYPALNEYVLLEGITGPGAAALNRQRLKVNSGVVTLTPGATTTLTFTLEVSTAFAANGAQTGKATACRNPSYDSYSLTTYTMKDKPSLTAPTVLAPSIALVANTVRDWGGKFGLLIEEGYQGKPKRRPKQIPRRLSLDVAGTRILMGAPGYGVAFQAPYVLPVTDAGASGVNFYPNTGYDRPRSLGLPKAILQDIGTDQINNDQITTPAATAIWTPDGVYKVQVAYKDDFTGEVGLASESVSVTVGGSAAGSRKFIEVFYLHPGYLLAECHATSLNVYVSRKNGSVLGFYKNVKIPKFGAEPNNYSGPVTKGLIYLNLYNFDPEQSAREEIDFTQTPPVIPQMPMGCKAVRTIKGTTFYGGSFGDVGQRNELQSGGITTKFDVINAATSHRKKQQIACGNFDSSANTLDAAFNVANAGIPPAYAGTDLFSQESFQGDPETVSYADRVTTPPGVPLDKTVTIDKLMHTSYGTSVLANPENCWPRYQVDGFRFVQEQTYGNSSRTAYLVLPRGQVWYSEQGRPGETPSINRIIVDADGDEDVEALGRYQDSLVICTRTQTYVLTWNQSPRGAAPVLLSSQYGCIAPNSMVEFPGGLAWLSDRGPVVLANNQLRWIGNDLREAFTGISPLYQRDSKGMMLHSWAVHDPERECIYFGVRSGRLAFTMVDEGFNGYSWSTASDNLKTKFPCDEILVFSYTTGGWSVWRPRFPIHSMSRGLCDDGLHRMLFVAAPDSSDTTLSPYSRWLVCALDDSAQDGNFEPVKATATTSGTASTNLTVDVTVNDTAGGGKYVNGTYVTAGMEVIIYNPTSKQVVATSTLAVTPPDGDPTPTLSLSSACTWSTGDTVLIGTLSMVIETAKMNMENTNSPKKVDSVSLRHSLYSRLASDTAYTSVPSFTRTASPLVWAKLDLETERATTSISAPTSESTSRYDLLGDAASNNASGNSSPGKALVKMFRYGSNRGHEFSVILRIIGGQQIRLNNIVLEGDLVAK